MKAARWIGVREVEVELVPKPTITDPSDAIVEVTHCTISGADLQIYEGDLNDAVKKGDILGQEAIGLVEEVGSNVKTLRPGDRVIILPVVACGSCDYCQHQEYSLCDVSNPSPQMESMYGHRIAGQLGYSRLFGGYPGNQAEYCRVPNADLVCVKVPKDLDAKKLLALPKVITSAWHALELAEVQAGDVVGVWGCGPVGLAVQRLAKLRGAKKIYAMDKDPQRLQIAEEFGMTTVNVDAHPDVGPYLLSIEPSGLDRAIEASGFRSTQKVAHAATRIIGLERESSDTVAAIIHSLKKGGCLAMISEFLFTTHGFPIGAMMQKGWTVRGGPAPAPKVRYASSFCSPDSVVNNHENSTTHSSWISSFKAELTHPGCSHLKTSLRISRSTMSDPRNTRSPGP